MQGRRWSRTVLALVIAVPGGACSLALDTSEFIRGEAPPPPATSPSSSPPDDPTGPVDFDAGASYDAANPDADGCATADLTTDPRHCGRCGRDCAGGQCLGGECAPVVMKSGLGSPLGVAVAGDHVYVGAHDGILRVSIHDGSSEYVTGPTDVNYMTASSTHLWWATGSSIVRWPLGGGPIETVVSQAPGSMGIALGPDHVYFTRYAPDGRVERALLDGGSRETVFASYDRPEDIDFADGELFVGGDGEDELAVFADGGFGSKRVLTSGNAPVAMAVWGPDVFFVRQGDDTVRRMPITGGTSVRIANAGGEPCGIAVTADSVYWVTCVGGQLYRLVR